MKLLRINKNMRMNKMKISKQAHLIQHDLNHQRKMKTQIYLDKKLYVGEKLHFKHFSVQLDLYCMQSNYHCYIEV